MLSNTCWINWTQMIRLGQFGAYIPAGTRVFRGVRPDVVLTEPFVDLRRPFDLYSNSRYSYFGTRGLAYDYCRDFAREVDSLGRRGKIVEYSVLNDTPVVELAIHRWDPFNSRVIFPVFERLMQLGPPKCQHGRDCIHCCFGYKKYRPGDTTTGYPAHHRQSIRSCDAVFAHWYFTISPRGFYFISGANYPELVLSTRAAVPTGRQWFLRA